MSLRTQTTEIITEYRTEYVNGVKTLVRTTILRENRRDELVTETRKPVVKYPTAMASSTQRSPALELTASSDSEPSCNCTTPCARSQYKPVANNNYGPTLRPSPQIRRASPQGSQGMRSSNQGMAGSANQYISPNKLMKFSDDTMELSAIPSPQQSYRYK